MTIISPTSSGQSAVSPSSGASQPTLAVTVKHLAGMLWDEMLSELNENGFNSGALGTGGDGFQSMFLWNIAQNDFGKYDSQLTAAAINQIGGRAVAAPATAASVVPPAIAPSAAPFATAAGTSASAAPADIASTGSTGQGATLLQQATNFARTVWPEITSAAQQLGVPAVALLAQSALETGWGNAAAGNNLFGIKAVDGEASTSRPTQEVVDGVLTPQMASFRDYPSAAASISDYVGQIQSGFQNVVGQNTVGGFAQALQASGYATDTNYATKIISISHSPMMERVLAAIGGQTSNATSNQ